MTKIYKDIYLSIKFVVKMALILLIGLPLVYFALLVLSMGLMRCTEEDDLSFENVSIVQYPRVE